MVTEHEKLNEVKFLSVHQLQRVVTQANLRSKLVVSFLFIARIFGFIIANQNG